MKSNAHLLSIAGLIFAISITMADEPQKDAKKDADKIQGKWGAVIYVQDGQGDEKERVPVGHTSVEWIFKGDKVTLLADVEGASVEGTFKLDPTKKPKTIDFVFPTAREGEKAQKSAGIYELDGETFKICYALEGKRRPKEFHSKEGSKQVLIVFEHAKE